MKQTSLAVIAGLALGFAVSQVPLADAQVTQGRKITIIQNIGGSSDAGPGCVASDICYSASFVTGGALDAGSARLGSLRVTGDAGVTGNLGVSGTTTSSGALYASSTLDVASDAGVGGNLGVTGALACGPATVSGTLQVASDAGFGGAIYSDVLDGGTALMLRSGGRILFDPAGDFKMYRNGTKLVIWAGGAESIYTDGSGKLSLDYGAVFSAAASGLACSATNRGPTVFDYDGLSFRKEGGTTGFMVAADLPTYAAAHEGNVGYLGDRGLLFLRSADAGTVAANTCELLDDCHPQSIAGAKTFTAHLALLTDAGVGGHLGVAGQSRLAGAVYASSTLDVTSDAGFGGTLGTIGATYLGSTLDVTSDAGFGGNLSAQGVTGRGSVTIGTGADPILNSYAASGTVAPGTIAAQNCEQATLTVTGARTPDVTACYFGDLSTWPDISCSCWVTANDTVTFRCCNPASTSADSVSFTGAARTFKKVP